MISLLIEFGRIAGLALFAGWLASVVARAIEDYCLRRHELEINAECNAVCNQVEEDLFGVRP